MTPARTARQAVRARAPASRRDALTARVGKSSLSGAESPSLSRRTGTHRSIGAARYWGVDRLICPAPAGPGSAPGRLLRVRDLTTRLMRRPTDQELSAVVNSEGPAALTALGRGAEASRCPVRGRPPRCGRSSRRRSSCSPAPSRRAWVGRGRAGATRSPKGGRRSTSFRRNCQAACTRSSGRGPHPDRTVGPSPGRCTGRRVRSRCPVPDVAGQPDGTTRWPG